MRTAAAVLGEVKELLGVAGAASSLSCTGRLKPVERGRRARVLLSGESLERVLESSREFRKGAGA
uniref:Uncharacterized protein n=1 Tax=Thermofilum pendens TaxID=2269 RepID=A0A7J3X6M1_THEPE